MLSVLIRAAFGVDVKRRFFQRRFFLCVFIRGALRNLIGLGRRRRLPIIRAGPSEAGRAHGDRGSRGPFSASGTGGVTGRASSRLSRYITGPDSLVISFTAKRYGNAAASSYNRLIYLASGGFAFV